MDKLLVTLFCILLLGTSNIHCLFTKKENILLIIQKKKTVTCQCMDISKFWW